MNTRQIIFFSMRWHNLFIGQNIIHYTGIYGGIILLHN